MPVAALLLVPALTGAAPGADQADPVVLLVDVSDSMNELLPEGTTGLEQAQQALRTLIDRIGDDRQVGLRSFSGECGPDGTVGVVPLGTGNRDVLREAVDGLVAGGRTPTDAGLVGAVQDLPDGRGTVVLVSDGLATCAPPCEVVTQFAAQGASVVVNTIGFRLSGDEQDQLRCIADETGGTFTFADDQASLEEAPEESAAATEDAPGFPAAAGTVAAVLAVVAAAMTAWIARPSTRWRQHRLVSASVRVAASGPLEPHSSPPADDAHEPPPTSVRLEPHVGEWTHEPREEADSWSRRD
ncbi:vWA domain-containing protein [Agromyces sp. ZXT2-6]|uniref:vWA domain-containing protein n=1 Tax=Agromyces sp. ZXT2-6 TaxID=3461153 RepID=UPI004054C3C5